MPTEERRQGTRRTILTENLDSQLGKDSLAIFENFLGAGETFVMIAYDPLIAKQAERRNTFHRCRENVVLDSIIFDILKNPSANALRLGLNRLGVFIGITNVISMIPLWNTNKCD